MENDELLKIERELTEVHESTKQAHKRLDKQDEKIEKLEQTYSVMQNLDYRMGHVEAAVKSIDNKLDQNVEKKVLKWDKLIDYLFYAILAYVLYKLGLKI